MRWIKFSAWTGVALSVIFLGILVYSTIFLLTFDFSNILQSQTSGLLILLPILGIISLIVACFFYFGFVKVGRKVDSKLMRISSWIIICGIALFLLVILILLIFGGSGNSGTGFSITGNAIADSFSSGSGIFWVILASLVLLTVFVAINLSFISLAEVSHKLKFSKHAAIFGILSISVSSVLGGVSFGLSLAVLAGGGSFLLLIAIVPQLLGLFALIFMTLTLFSASEEYESSGGGSQPAQTKPVSSYPHSPQQYPPYSPPHTQTQQKLKQQSQQDPQHSEYSSHSAQQYSQPSEQGSRPSPYTAQHPSQDTSHEESEHSY
jgi:hypothetical protein